LEEALFFCGSLCDVDDLDTNKHCVMIMELMPSVLAQCAARADKWGSEVEARLRTCNCLIAEEAVYHENCHRDFRPVTSISCDRPGRPVDSIKAENFELLCQWLKVNDCELLTLQDVGLTDKARLLTGESDSVYREKYIKQKLIKRYGEHIEFSEVCGKRNVICWKQMASFIVNQKWYDDQKKNADEHIVGTAAKLLRATIREAAYSTDFYPSTADITV